MPPGSESITAKALCGDRDRGPSRRVDLLAAALLVVACGQPAPRPSAAPVIIPAVAASAPASPPASALLVTAAPPAPGGDKEPEPEPEVEAEPDAGPIVPARKYLAPDVGARFPRRALLARSGSLRFVPGGPRLGDSRREVLAERLSTIVVEDHPRSLRVVLDDGAIRVVFFAPRAGFQVVSTRAVWLAPAADRAADPAAGARIAPGVALDEIAVEGPLHHVRGEASRVGFEGWIPDDAVGVSFVPARLPAGGRGGLVAEGTAIVGPSGDVLARLPPPPSKDRPPSFSFEVAPLSGAPAGFQAIHLGLPAIEVNGLVPSASYRKPSPTGGSSSGSGFGRAGGFMTDSERGLLRRGAELLDDTGEPVGVTLAEVEVFMSFVRKTDNSPIRWARMLVGPFGFCGFQVRKADVRPFDR
jgi:hypothetical protein